MRKDNLKYIYITAALFLLSIMFPALYIILIKKIFSHALVPDETFSEYFTLFMYTVPWFSLLFLSSSVSLLSSEIITHEAIWNLKIIRFLHIVIAGLILICPVIIFIIVFKIFTPMYYTIISNSGIYGFFFRMDFSAEGLSDGFHNMMLFLFYIMIFFILSNISLLRQKTGIIKTAVEFLFMVCISGLYLIGSYTYAIKWQKELFTYYVITVNILFVISISVLIIRHYLRKKSSLNLLFIESLMYIWFFWAAFPYLGESI